MDEVKITLTRRELSAIQDALNQQIERIQDVGDDSDNESLYFLNDLYGKLARETK